VLTPVELESRFEVYAEQYILSIEVEAKLVINMAKTMVYPAAVEYLSKLSSTISSLSSLGVSLEASSAQTVATLASAMMKDRQRKLSEALATHDFATTEDHMKHCAFTVRPLMDQVRESGDALEGEIADSFWPLPDLPGNVVHQIAPGQPKFTKTSIGGKISGLASFLLLNGKVCKGTGCLPGGCREIDGLTKAPGTSDLIHDDFADVTQSWRRVHSRPAAISAML
jgi:hypothetical protein